MNFKWFIDSDLNNVLPHWVIPEKVHTPPRRKFLSPSGVGENNLFLIIVSVSGRPGGGGLTSYFLCGGSMNAFWNDPFPF